MYKNKILLFSLLFICACSGSKNVKVQGASLSKAEVPQIDATQETEETQKIDKNFNAPQGFIYKEIKAKNFPLISYQKITDPSKDVRIYLEGDGRSFDAKGRATKDPTPHSSIVRDAAFKDPYPNVVYLGRPCQYILGAKCEKKYWTTDRFDPAVTDSIASAIKKIRGKSDVVLVGFSGGGHLAGLVSVLYPYVRVKQVITIAADLDVDKWTTYHNVPRLTGSFNLADHKDLFKKMPQHHYVGSKDKIVPPEIVYDFVGDKSLVTVIDGATHKGPWDVAFEEIYQMR